MSSMLSENTCLIIVCRMSKTPKGLRGSRIYWIQSKQNSVRNLRCIDFLGVSYQLKPTLTHFHKLMVSTEQ